MHYQIINNNVIKLILVHCSTSSLPDKCITVASTELLSPALRSPTVDPS